MMSSSKSYGVVSERPLHKRSTALPMEGLLRSPRPGSPGRKTPFKPKASTPAIPEHVQPVRYGSLDDRPRSEASDSRHRVSPVSDMSIISGATSSQSVYEDEEEDALSDEDASVHRSKRMQMLKTVAVNVKIFILFALTVICSIFFVLHPENETFAHPVVVQPNQIKIVRFPWNSNNTLSEVSLSMSGAFLESGETSERRLTVSVPLCDSASQSSVFYLNDSTDPANDVQSPSAVSFECDFNSSLSSPPSHIEVQISLSASLPAALTLTCQGLIFSTSTQTILAAVILICVYGAIMFEVVHRAMAAALGSLAAITVLAVSNQRPSLEEVISWIDFQTISLLFGMMVMVAIFSESGFFDYCAMKAYKVTSGRLWPLLGSLILLCTVVSAFLDNVTTILLLTPVTIRLCEVLGISPQSVLMAEIIFSNIGGTATGVGDPPNVLLISNKRLNERGITFSNFTVHMAVGTVFVIAVSTLVVYLMFRNVREDSSTESLELSEMKHEVEIWRRTASRIAVATREESMVRVLLLQKVANLETLISKREQEVRRNGGTPARSFEEVLDHLIQESDQPMNPPLLTKSLVVLSVVTVMFFLSSFLDGAYVDLGWISLLGAIWLLVLADVFDLESTLHKVEWATLIFFAALFTMTEAVDQLGLFEFIGDTINDSISHSDPGYKLSISIVIVLWVSAICSSFIDNIPYTTAMIPVILKISDGPDGVPLLPLVLSLAFGACLGGNGTLIGASCNVVCSGIAEQHGYGFTFKEYFKVGMPAMLASVCVANIYLLICHSVLEWNT